MIPPTASDFLLYPLFREEIERLSNSPAARPAGRLLRLERQVACGAPLLDWIAASGAPESFFFRDKEHRLSLAGIGEALVAEAADPEGLAARLAPLWDADPSVPVFGGFAFDTAADAAAEWRPFGRCRFTLPRVELRRTGGTTRLAVHHLRPAGQTTEEALAELSAALGALDAGRPARSSAGPPSRDGSVRLVPDRTQWEQMIERALETIRAGGIQKAVLARKRIITRDGPWDPIRVAATLAEIRERSFAFCYRIAPGLAFVGRTPERLFRMRRGRITAEAIAGTRPRGANPSDDRRLERELLGSAKELEEHQIVAAFVENGMRQLCGDLESTAAGILKLRNVQHIVTGYRGRQTETRSPLSVARIFHPTPAVGGYPRDGISGFLRSVEPFARGWYGAPVGWMNRRDADFAVGIRSALVSGNELHLFAGAGIVAGSTASGEWDETEKKMDNFAALLRENRCAPCR